jgi:hypothetical protein
MNGMDLLANRRWGKAASPSFRRKPESILSALQNVNNQDGFRLAPE